MPYKKETKENMQTTVIWITCDCALEKIQRQLCSPVWVRNAQDLISTCVTGKWLQETMEMCGKPNRDKNCFKNWLPCEADKLQLLQWQFGVLETGWPSGIAIPVTAGRVSASRHFGNTSDREFEFVSIETMDINGHWCYSLTVNSVFHMHSIVISARLY